MYYPNSKAGNSHPTLKTNLLKRQLEVCKELGVRTQIYISAGLDENRAVKFPHFCNIRRGNENTLLGGHWHGLCLNNDEYLNILKAETEEVMDLFRGMYDGLFFDIVEPSPCVCPVCINSMLEHGLNPNNPEDVEKHRRIVYMKYANLINSTVAAKDPEMAVFHNRHLPKNDRELLFTNTKHIEIESLPTGGWGYDHFPLGAAYSRVLGREFTGMTGKFHKSWGEFGGYKHPNALKYETALSIANGAKCCVGDQLHPLGKCDSATYKLIGKAYAEVEKREKWCNNVTAVADIALLTTYTDKNRGDDDIGANRILLEGKYLYNIIDNHCSFDDYKLIVFSDNVKFNAALADKVEKYLANGGKILLTGESGVKADSETEFFKNFGVKMNGENPFDATYLVPTYDMAPNGIAAYLMYNRGFKAEITDSGAKILANIQDSYFNREFRQFCSHKNTPNNPETLAPAAVISPDGKIGYIAYKIFDDYRHNGALHQKQIVCDMLDALLGDDKTLSTNLPSNGVVTLMEQKYEKRYINHLLYCVTKKRGDTEVIEDEIPIHNTHVSIKLGAKPSRVYLAPSEEELPFTYENGVLSYVVPVFETHGMVVIDK